MKFSPGLGTEQLAVVSGIGLPSLSRVLPQAEKSARIECKKQRDARK